MTRTTATTTPAAIATVWPTIEAAQAAMQAAVEAFSIISAYGADWPAEPTDSDRAVVARGRDALYEAAGRLIVALDAADRLIGD